jgi:hypothetical protein
VAFIVHDFLHPFEGSLDFVLFLFLCTTTEEHELAYSGPSESLFDGAVFDSAVFHDCVVLDLFSSEEGGIFAVFF